MTCNKTVPPIISATNFLKKKKIYAKNRYLAKLNQTTPETLDNKKG